MRSYLHRPFRRVSPFAPAVRRASARFRPTLEALDDRTLPSAVTGLHVVPSPAVNHLVLYSTSAIAPNDVWAVGSAPSPRASENVPIAEHFNGTSWSVVPTAALPSGTTGELFGVSAVASNNVWAVGMLSGGTTQLIEHWDGVKWSVAPAPSVGSGWLNAVTALSANDVWAVGLSAGSDLIEHFNGTSWTIIPSPNATSYSNKLTGVTALSTGDVVAVGNAFDANGNTTTLILSNN